MVENKGVNMKDRILKFLKKQVESVNLKEISIRLKISYPTVLKYCDILNAEGKVNIRDYGNVRLIKIK